MAVRRTGTAYGRAVPSHSNYACTIPYGRTVQPPVSGTARARALSPAPIRAGLPKEADGSHGPIGSLKEPYLVWPYLGGAHIGP